MSIFAQLGFTDSFGKFISDGVKNVLNLNGNHPYSPERWRIFVNGSRVFPEYNTVNEYNHTGTHHELIPQAANDTVVLQTADAPNYLAQNEFLATFSAFLNQTLATGEEVKCGLFDGTDGWYIKKTASQTSTEVQMVVLSNGTETITETGSLQEAITIQNIFYLQTSWYRVGPQIWGQYYNSAQNRIEEHAIGRTGASDKSNNSEKSSLPLRFEVTLGASTTGLKLNVGSISIGILGNAQTILRTKSATFSGAIGSTNTWVPIVAFRKDPTRLQINGQIASIKTLEYSASDDVEIAALAFDSSNVAFSGGSWSTPATWSSQNNIIQTRDNISTIVDSTGSSVATATDPGGYQLGYDILVTTGTGSAQSLNSGSGVDRRREIKDGDIVVIMGKSATTGTVKFQLTIEQEW